LVVIVGLRNVGDKPLITTYGLTGVFRDHAGVEFVLTTSANAVIPTFKIQQSDAIVFETNPNFIKEMGIRAPAIKPGEAVRAKKTILLVRIVDDRWVWLQPGTYRIQAKIRIQRLAEEFTTAAETFTVKPLAPEDQGVLSIFTPDLASVLRGQGARREQDAAIAKVAELHKKFPRAPHRQYVEFHLLWAVPTREEKVAKANAYLVEFPKSPYVDDVLWNLARMEREADDYDKAAAHLETLLRDYPDSSLKQEVEELQKKMKEAADLQKKLKEARERAAERKATQEENPAPSQE
jgi:tetratricopeptide (TPR) repeat protein